MFQEQPSRNVPRTGLGNVPGTGPFRNWGKEQKHFPEHVRNRVRIGGPMFRRSTRFVFCTLLAPKLICFAFSGLEKPRGMFQEQLF